MFFMEPVLASLQAQMNVMRSMLPPVDVSVIIKDLIEQGERKVDRLAFWMAVLPDWLEPTFILKTVRKLEAITDQLEHFTALNR